MSLNGRRNGRLLDRFRLWLRWLEPGLGVKRWIALMGGGIFLVITVADPTDILIPGKSYSFGQLKTAQALGDFAALGKHGRPALRLHLTEGAEAGLRTVASAVERALAAMGSA